MIPQTTYEQAALALARLLNMDSIPQTESGRVSFYIASAVQRVLRAFDWTQQLTFAAVTTDTNGRVPLSALSLGMAPGIESVNNGTQFFTLVVPSERYQYVQGSYRYNIVLEGGEWVLYSSEPNTAITIGYYQTPDTVSSTITVAFQPMVIAKAALIYYRQAQDPEADTEQEEDAFRQEIAELAEAQERRRPQYIGTGPRERYGGSIGDTGNGYGRRYR